VGDKHQRAPAGADPQTTPAGGPSRWNFVTGLPARRVSAGSQGASGNRVLPAPEGASPTAGARRLLSSSDPAGCQEESNPPTDALRLLSQARSQRASKAGVSGEHSLWDRCWRGDSPQQLLVAFYRREGTSRIAQPTIESPSGRHRRLLGVKEDAISWSVEACKTLVKPDESIPLSEEVTVRRYSCFSSRSVWVAFFAYKAACQRLSSAKVH